MSRLDAKACDEWMDTVVSSLDALAKMVHEADSRFKSAMNEGTVAEFEFAAAWMEALEDAVRPLRRFGRAVCRRTKEIEEEAS
jgi:hypothetical protein